MTTYDVAVVGLGAAGSATLSALARAGLRSIGIDRYHPPHAMGSSHGETRLLRTAYAEGPYYVPLVRRAITLWKAAERRTGARLFEQSGVTYAGPADNLFIRETRAAAEQKQVRLTQSRQTETWFDLPEDWLRFREMAGGYVYPERAIQTFLAEARRHGAKILKNCRCEAIDRAGEDVALHAARGIIHAKRVVVATGAWTIELVPELNPVIFVERRVLHWFADPKRRHTRKRGFTPFAIGLEDGQMVYGFPANAKGEVKIAEHLRVQTISSPDALDRKIARADISAIEAPARRLLPALGRRVRSIVCMYPMARDERFILARHPDDARMIVGAGLSGHGFKFAPAIGEVLANLVRERPQKVDIAPFGWPSAI